MMYVSGQRNGRYSNEQENDIGDLDLKGIVWLIPTVQGRWLLLWLGTHCLTDFSHQYRLNERIEVPRRTMFEWLRNRLALIGTEYDQRRRAHSFLSDEGRDLVFDALFIQ